MQYGQKSFTVPAINSDTYRDNWERIFRPKKSEEPKTEKAPAEPEKPSEG